MVHEKIELWAEHPECFLKTYVSEDSPVLNLPPRKAMIVCPGGGYEFLSVREAEPIAKKYFAEGMNVFVLYYSVAPNAKDFVPLIELAMAITHVRENCEKYHIDPDAVFVTGFSAGGHLAASSATLWNHKKVREALGIDRGLRKEGINRPTGTVLCYPVITAGEYAHKPSIAQLCGNQEVSDCERDVFSLEKQVEETTSPAFLWHTFTDQLVPVQNTLLYAEALTKHKVPFEAHVFPYGPHGLSLGTPEVGRVNEHVQCWFGLAINWIRDFNK
ncbi:MAG: alpha/beta hydrolase [Clostridia bacterium]|nr:alpha/beta hydrolase [Clostridia bacterium]